ncbi:response regulator [bacterium]|nr:response regulator [bacterium]
MAFEDDEKIIRVGDSFQDSFNRIRLLIEAGEDPQAIYQAVASSAASLPGVTSVSIFLPEEAKDDFLRTSVVAQSGKFEIPPPSSALFKNPEDTLAVNAQHPIQYFDIVNTGSPVGSLAVALEKNVSTETLSNLSILAHLCSSSFQAQRLNSTLHHYMDRLDVLNQFMQLLISHPGLHRTVKLIAREVAFRVGADSAICLLNSGDNENFEPVGIYGQKPEMLPRSFSMSHPLLGYALKTGRILSVPDISTQTHYGLSFLGDIGVVSACCARVEFRGTLLAALIVGFKQPRRLSERDSTLFDEFSRGAAIAIANAQAQERLTTYAEKLESLVQERTADLAVQMGRVEEESRAKSHFVANVSHEFRTPLTAIIGYSTVLADGVFGPVTDKQRDALLSIGRSSQHLKELIDDILNIARIESGKEDPKPARIELQKILEQSHKLMVQSAQGKGITLEPLVLDQGLSKEALWIDPRHIRQILINFLSNAIKYTPSGGIVRVEAQIMSDKIRIGVRDTGVGIPRNQVEKIFSRFERGTDSYSEKQTGTGLGLALTKRLVEINGGTIGFESEVNRGSFFWALVPRAADQEDAVNQPAVQAVVESGIQEKLAGLSILVVDDNELTCEVLKTIIHNAGGTAHTAFSVGEARRLVDDTPVDIALVDLAMPGESGLNLIDYIRTHTAPQTNTLPVIVVSACAFPTDQEKAVEHGASLFIPKPFQPHDIVTAIRDQVTSNVLTNSGKFKISL